MSTSINFNYDDVLIAKDKDGKEYYVGIYNDTEGCEWIQDECPLGHLISWHRRYSIGEKHDYSEPADLWRTLIMDRYGYKYNEPEDTGKKKFKEYARLLFDYSGIFIKEDVDEDGTTEYYLCYLYQAETEDEKVIILDYDLSTDDLDKFTEDDEDALFRALDELTDEELISMVDHMDDVEYYPVFMYDHSGIALSISNAYYPFNDRWDSGCIGFWYITKEEADKEGWLGDNWKQRFRDCIKSYIEEFNEIQEGNCWGFAYAPRDVIDSRIGHLKKGRPYWLSLFKDEILSFQEDVCWGFIGDYDDLVEEYCRDEHLEIVGVVENE